MLDDAFYPPYFVAFVVYHEMLHNVVPGKTDAMGYYRVHTPEFKRLEKQFAEYDMAMKWEKKHKELIF